MKPRWLQLHLSTALVLSFVAGGLLWLNTQSRIEPERKIQAYYESAMRCNSAGWPFTFIYWASEWRSDEPDDVFPAQWRYSHLALNIVIAIAILAAVYALAEWRIRSRKSESPSTKQ